MPLAFLSAGVLAVSAARAGLVPYPGETDLVASAPGTDDGAAAAMWNPAQWGLLERPEFALWWSDRQALGHRREDYGFSGGRGLGFSYRHRIAPAPGGPRGVGDYQIGAGWGNRGSATGIAYGFSGPGRSAFDRKSFVSLGGITRPSRWLSFGTSGRLTSGESQGALDLGIRPLSDPRVLLFGDYALQSHQRWDDGALSGGIGLRPIPGIEVSGKWSRRDRFQLTLGLTLGRSGFRTMSQFADGERGATWFMARLDPPVRGADLERLALKRRRVLEMSWKGDVVYQSSRYFDEGSLSLRQLLDDLELAAEDPTVDGVAINLSGFEANTESKWELREKLLALRRAGKHAVLYCDRLGGGDYYLASAADRILMDPMGSLLIPGVQASRTYMKDALGKLGIGFEEWRYFKYKSALETFSRRDMSEADREQYGALVRESYEELASGIVASGRMTRAQFDSVVNAEPYLSARRLHEIRWIDQIGSPESLRVAAKRLAGRSVQFSTASRVRRARWTPNEDWGSEPVIALVYAVGECAMETGIHGRETAKALRKFRERRDVKALVMRVDSPGGDPLPSDLLAREMKAYRPAKKPLYVSQGRVAGSGGYWISMDAERIAASPFTLTGSIGVIGGWVWNQGLGKKLGLTSDRVQVGKSADLLGGLGIPLTDVRIPERNLDDREREVAKRGILELYDDFTSRVAEARGLPVERVRQIAEGHVYAGRTALELKLVDRIASLDQTIASAREAAGIPKSRHVRIEEFPKRRLFRLPGVVRWTGSGPGGSDGWTYVQRTLSHLLRSPGLPLLLTPPSLLPDETAAR